MAMELRLSIRVLPLDASGLREADDSCDERVAFHTFGPAFTPHAPMHVPLKRSPSLCTSCIFYLIMSTQDTDIEKKQTHRI